MKTPLFICMAILICLNGCEDNPTESNLNSESSITIVSLIPEPESTITSNDTIRATLAYSIASDVQSDFGFTISIKFVSIIEGQTFSVGEAAQTELILREGNVTMNYPLELIWDHQNLKQPVSCYFYLHKMTSQTSSSVLARTTEIGYNE